MKYKLTFLIPHLREGSTKTSIDKIEKSCLEFICTTISIRSMNLILTITDKIVKGGKAVSFTNKNK